MALKISFIHRHGKITMKSGHFYTFKYKGFENDPNPHILMLNKISGIHPKSGHEHRYIQALNLSYIPRKDRKKFVKDWIENFSKSKNIKFTWDLVKRKYPYLQVSIRRYFYKPNYYITKLEDLDTIEKIQKTIVGNLFKDFSKSIRRKLGKVMRKWL